MWLVYKDVWKRYLLCKVIVHKRHSSNIQSVEKYLIVAYSEESIKIRQSIKVIPFLSIESHNGHHYKIAKTSIT